MAAIHGGLPRDYPVSQATITPFLITCRNSYARDAIVQRGLYTIPEAQVQFTVHAWHPRFGMGLDPPTHQVWIQIVGLPLQAWKTSEIVEILRKFGHPLEILSFGQDAGHYRDIVALVDTKHPTRIPLAYVYMEGDFSTQIEIVILSCRLRQAGYFPPPAIPPSPSNTHPQLQQTQTPPTQGHNHYSDASSSTAAPSEPTIDLSSWSPRSYSSLSAANEAFNFDFQGQRAIKGKQPASPPTLSPVRSLKPTSIHIPTLNAATEDLTYSSDTNQTQLFKWLCTLTIARPIAINTLSLSLLSATTQLCTLRQIPNRSKALKISASYSAFAAQLNGEIKRLTSAQVNLEILPEGYSRPQSPQTILIDEAQIERNRISQACARIALPPITETNTQADRIATFSTSPPHLSQVAHFESQLAQQSTPPSSADCNDSLLHPHPPHCLPDPHPIDGILKATQSHRSDSLAFKKRKMVKKPGNTEPMRRSQRLRAKERKTCAIPNPLTATTKKKKIEAIDFQLKSQDIPLEQSTALAILQASGVEINTKVEEMIQEAINTDLANADKEDSAPCTPLHDSIPPLTVAGDSLVL